MADDDNNNDTDQDDAPAPQESNAAPQPRYGPDTRGRYPIPQHVRYRVRKHPAGGHVATIEIPCGKSPAVISMGGDNALDAIMRAQKLAEQITSNPVFAAVAPPGTALAVKAIGMLASNPTARTLGKFAGRGARKLAHLFGF